MEPFPLPPNPNEAENDSELRELAALAGLLNPESIWLLEEKLDDLNAVPPPIPTPPSTKYTGGDPESPFERD